jgi:N-methylhydantoinase A
VVAERRRDTVRSLLTTDLDAARELADGASRVVCELRYRGQAFELAVEGTDDLREKFEAEHEQAYGYRDEDNEVELVSVRITTVEPGPEIGVEDAEETAGEIEGPTVVRLPESTLVVPEGWRGKTEAAGTIRLWTR